MTSREREQLLSTNNQTCTSKEPDIQGGSGSSELFESQDQDQGQGQGPATGLTVLTTTFFLVGEMAGSGILALPQALESTGYIGIVMLLVLAFVCAYTGKLLGTCWLMVQERYEEYRGHVRHPYPLMGQITYGKVARILVTFCNNFTMFGGATVFLILASQNIHGLIVSLLDKQFSFCYIQLIVAGLLLPLSWMGTPKDFWPIAIGAASATCVASVILIAASIQDKLGPYKNVPVTHSNADILKFFEALGIVLFAFGGHPSFPTFQNDMKQPKKFGKAVYLSYFIMTMMYLPVALVGFLVYGANLKDNVLNTITPGPLLYVVQILITCHLFCSFVIVLNPVVQEVEELFKMPKEFSWKRIISRSIVVGLVLFTAESIPRFGTILSLIGGSSMVLLICVFPPLFFLKLQKMEGPCPKM